MLDAVRASEMLVSNHHTTPHSTTAQKTMNLVVVLFLYPFCLRMCTRINTGSYFLDVLYLYFYMLYMGVVFTWFSLGGPKVRDHWEDLGVGGKITLIWTLGIYGSMGRTRFGWLVIGSVDGLL
jgi:hypothetical protein